MAQAPFIVLEGIDGSGTTSQSKALERWLVRRGHAVVRTHEPSAGVIGATIRTALDVRGDRVDPRCLALLFAADRLHHVHDEIDPARARGSVVVCDRYLLSSWAYQSIECDPAWVREINRHAPWPDLTFVLDVPVEIALARVHARQGAPHEIFENEPHQHAVAKAYGEFLAADLEGVHRIDGTLEPEGVTRALTRICETLGL
jgi:dTMP kinase